MNIRNNIISSFLITLGIILLIQPLTETKADNDNDNDNKNNIIVNQEEVIKPIRLNINLAIDSPEDLKVNEGDEIKKGQIIATRERKKRELDNNLSRLKLSLEKIKTLQPLPPNPPLEIPPLSVLPPISYLEYEAEIEKKKIDIDFINDEIKVKQEEIDYLSQLPELDEKVINHEKAKLNKLRQTLTIASKEYQLAKGKYESAKSERKYKEYQAQIDKVKRIENINQQRQSYERELALYQQRKSEHEIKINELNNQISLAHEKLQSLSNSTSPYSGIVRRIKLLSQSPDGTINAELSLMVRNHNSELGTQNE